MKYKSNDAKKLIIVVLCLLISIMGIILLWPNKKSDSLNARVEESNFNVKEWRQKVIAEINKNGPEKTHSALVNQHSDNYTLGHNILHIFGEEIYRLLGKKGITICDEKLGFGCFNGLSTAALVSNGVGVLSELEEICKAKYPTLVMNCIHGLGHGALEYYGRNNIHKAIDACSQLTRKDVLIGCVDGVFMEYFTTDIFGEPYISKDKIITNGVCPEIVGKYKLTCYKNLAHFWVKKSRLSLNQIGFLCGKIQNKESRSACYYGIGNIIPVMGDYNPKISTSDLASGCDKMPNLDANTTCRTAIFALLSRGEFMRNNANNACLDLPNTYKEDCLRRNIIQVLENYDEK